MMRRAGLLLALLAGLSLAASEAERRSLEAYQAALAAADRKQRIEHLTDSLAEHHSEAAEFLLGRTVWEHPEEARLAADLLLTKLAARDEAPSLSFTDWMVFGLRQRFPAWQIGFDRWRQLEEAALAPVRKEGAALTADDRETAARLMRLLAHDELRLLHFDAARRIYEEGEKLDPDPDAEDTAYFYTLTALAASVWDPGSAALRERFQTELENFAAQEPKDDAAPDAWIKYGSWYLQFHDEAGALRVMKKLEELHPQWPGTLLFRLSLLKWQGDYAALAEQAAALKGDDRLMAHLFRFRAAICNDRWDEALKIAKLLRESPRAPSLMVVEALIRAGRSREADAEIRKFPSPTRENLMLHNAMHRKDFKGLLESMRKAEAKLKGEELKALRLTIVALATCTGDRDLLQEYWDKLEKNGDLADPKAANTVGYTAATLSYKLPEAQKLIESALAAEPFSEAIQDSMAWVLFQQGDLAGARCWIDRSLACSDRDNDTEIECHAGDICAAQGDREAAAAHYRRALALRPREPDIDEAAIRAKLAELEKPLP